MPLSIPINVLKQIHSRRTNNLNVRKQNLHEIIEIIRVTVSRDRLRTLWIPRGRRGGMNLDTGTDIYILAIICIK